MGNNKIAGKIVCVTIFSISMAFVESAAVVYLRAIFYPEGFTFPLKAMADYKILVEVLREVATICMLLSVAFLAGKMPLERFACFMLAFGVWDIFYYVWLKVLLDWPSSLFDWDILFLIPLPWIGPVIAPLSIAILMTVFGTVMVHSCQKRQDVKPSLLSAALALAGTIFVLYSFMHDTGATLNQQPPRPYRYGLLIAGNILFTASFIVLYVKRRGKAHLAPLSD